MKTTLVAPHELDADCIARWEDLRDANPIYASPFYSPHFAKTVGDIRRDAQIAIFEKKGEIVGFLPFHRVRGRIAKPIGGHLNDYQGAILAPGLALSDSGLLKSAGITAYDFDHLPSQLGRGAKSVKADQVSPQMDLAGGYDQCVSAKGESWRRGYRDIARKARKLERELGPIRFEFAAQSPLLFECHAAMRNALYRRMGVPEDFGTGWQGEVLHALRVVALPEFRSVLSVLFAGAQPVAAHFGLMSRGVLHWWFPAYELAAQRYSPGLQLIDHCALHAADCGIDTIDFGKGEDRYKTLFADTNLAMLKGSICCKGSFAERTRSGSAELLTLAESVLPASLKSYPRRSLDRFWTGTALPRLG